MPGVSATCTSCSARSQNPIASSPVWLNELMPTWVLVQAGHLNRFGHPAPAVERRWLRAGAAFWRSDRDGAVMAESRAAGLDVWAQRARHRRYWHGR